jgi:putative nucleotidyltransferase with HDIG domain
MPNDKGSKVKKIWESLPQRTRHFLDSLADRLYNGKNEKLIRVVTLLSTAFLLTLLVLPKQHFITTKFNSGDISSTDIRATQGYLLEDRLPTEKKRAAAEAAAPYVYDFNPRKMDELMERFAQAFSLIAKAKNDSVADSMQLREALAETFGCEVSDTEFSSLQRVKSEKILIAEIKRLATPAYARKIVADTRIFAADSNHGILIIDNESGAIVGAGDSAISFAGLEDARNIVRKIKAHVDGDSRDSENIKELLVKALQPSLVFNRDATEARKREASAAVRPVLYQVKRGEMIVREGERITEEQALKLNKIFEVRRGINKYFSSLGIFGLILVIFYFPYRFSRKNIRKFNPSSKDLILLAILTVVLFLLMSIAHTVSAALGMLFPHIDTADYFYLFPFAVGPMLVRIILNSEVALVYCVACAPMMGMLFNNSLPVVIYALLGGVIGAHGVRQCKNRGTIYTAGLKVSVVNLALAIPFQVLTDNMLTMQTVYVIIFALIGGVANALIVSGTVPVIESLFRYTTDIKLLELSNLNSPILRELMIRAPGTYHHSVMVGNLVEAAAEAINANPLLARVAAYYHDIGKVSKPLYFIENIRDGENKHDKLTPSMSALILISHVKEGVELARDHRLGLPIIDMIRQHHGTALIKYFYQKAQSHEEQQEQAVDEVDFRYPGPKPQTREAGLVLLADCVEAASKTLTDPTPARIQGMVQKIINNIFIDGQLEECELSLKSLHDIAKSFIQVLSGIYHQRIDYPEPVFKGNERKKSSEDTDREPAKTPANSGSDAQKKGGEDIKRLGISR